MEIAMKTGIYVRVSTEEQAQEGFSIRGQEQKLKDYALIKDWTIYKIYADEGISGKNITERPAVNELILDIKAGHVKNVLVFKIDRLTRSTADLLYLVDLFNQHDCAFNSLMESIDTQTASGRMFLKIIGIFAEFERENIIERVKLGNERKVKEGYTLGGRRVSYGYDRPKGQEIQTINEAEAFIVRDIFEMYVRQGMSITAIARVLNLRGIPTKEASTWTNSQVKDILTNPSYIGKVRYHVKKAGYIGEGLHEPIIPAELFEEAQKLIAKNLRSAPTNRPGEKSYFTGILECADCRKKMYPHTDRDQIRYFCTGRRFGLCKASSMNHRDLETAFSEYIERIETLSELDTLNLKKQKQARQEARQALQAYQEKQQQLKRREKEIMRLYVHNEMEFDTYKFMKKQISDDLVIIQKELERLSAFEEEKEPALKKENIVADLKRNWELLTAAEKRLFLVKFVQSIYAANEIPEGKRYGKIRVVEVVFQGVFSFGIL
ncbi:MAG: recombinase family protein [Oscillospiraceae bacterium]|nr:recombinase family protein [Oscillospiraceae bacterium]